MQTCTVETKKPEQPNIFASAEAIKPANATIQVPNAIMMPKDSKTNAIKTTKDNTWTELNTEVIQEHPATRTELIRITLTTARGKKIFRH